jgi:hypothetical protein
MITFAELVPLYLTALAVMVPILVLRTWRRERLLTLDLRRER